MRRRRRSSNVARADFGLNSGQFRARFVSDVVHPVSVVIPIAGVAEVALQLVQHGVAFCSLDLRENSHANQRKRFLIHAAVASSSYCWTTSCAASHLPAKASSIARSISALGARMAGVLPANGTGGKILEGRLVWAGRRRFVTSSVDSGRAADRLSLRPFPANLCSPSIRTRDYSASSAAGCCCG